MVFWSYVRAMNDRHLHDQRGGNVLILGSGPNVVQARDWPRAPFDQIVAINNAWAVRSDWDYLIHPEDFAPERLPLEHTPQQRLITAADYVPAQNRFGGFVFAGGTMAFTAAYWALARLRPRVMAFLGCDMVYPAGGQTHFYGTGAPDPLRKDISLRDLGAKSARLAVIAANHGCHCVNLSTDAQSALLFPRAARDLASLAPHPVPGNAVAKLHAAEDALGYDTPTGRYWESQTVYDVSTLDELDCRWRALYAQVLMPTD